MDALLDSSTRSKTAICASAVDVIRVVERLMKVLFGQPGYAPPAHAGDEQNLIMVAARPAPADVIQFKQHQFASFITGSGRHYRRTPRSWRVGLNIPSIVWHCTARQLIRENELLIVDGTQGVIIVDPDPQALAVGQLLRQHQRELERRCWPSATPARPRLPPTRSRSNCMPTSSCRMTSRARAANGAMGIGLFRTEFLFLNRDNLPDEDEHRRSASAGRARNGRAAGHYPHLRPRRGQANQRRGFDGHQPGAGPARDLAVADRAADVPRAAARDAARVALRQAENTRFRC